MSPNKNMPQSQSRGPGPTPLTPESGSVGRSIPCDPIIAALKASNDDLQSRMAKLRTNSESLDQEILMLQRQIKESHHPSFEIWEADILTRLIEVAHTILPKKLRAGTCIKADNVFERELISCAYINAAKQIDEWTLQKLGLGEGYFDALRRFPEVVDRRSPNPFVTQSAFAKWLVEEKESLPSKYTFWGRLFPVCYGRTVEDSAYIL